jgi:putative ABC transport system ATP-binding protein
MGVTGNVRAAPAVEARGLYRFFHAAGDETLALREVSLTVAPGEIVAVVGPSGSGKSTLLACVAGLDEPDAGTVRIGGEVMTRRTEEERAALRARSVGLLFQRDNLVGHLTVDGKVDLPPRPGGAPAPAPPEAVLAALGVADLAAAYPGELSGGEAVRAGLAVALVNDPAVLLADEPTGELDGVTAARVLDLVKDRARAGCAVVVATHSAAVSGAADRVVELRDGKVAG